MRTERCRSVRLQQVLGTDPAILAQRSGTLVTDMPPEQLEKQKPSFSLFWFRMGDCFPPMLTSRGGIYLWRTANS